MSRRQLFLTYGIIMFMMLWGFDLINIIKFHQAISWTDVFSPFIFSQLLYALGTMLLLRFLITKYAGSKNYLAWFACVIACIIFFIAVRYITEEMLFHLVFGYGNYNPKTKLNYYILDNLYYAIIYIFLGFMVFLLDRQVGLQKKQAVLLQKNAEAELAFLKSQVSPHFLFNSLNNIYALSYKKSEKAPEAILKLSELVRYMLYEKREKIALAVEWKYIQNLISLQQLRYEFPLGIQTIIKGNLDLVQIPPYLLIPFVENIFKHGLLATGEDEAIIYLEADDKGLEFRVQNKIADTQKDLAGGIGLENVKRRLELLYPNRHKLDIVNDGTHFSTNLQIHIK